MKKKSALETLINRRHFVRASVLGTAGAMLGCEAARSGGDAPILFDIPDSGPPPQLLQFPPTTSIGLIAHIGNQAIDLMSVVVLGGTAVSTSPSFNWTTHKEHWFVLDGVSDIESIVANADEIEVKIHHYTSGAPDQEIEDFAQAVIDNGDRFHGYAKTILGTGDWVSGAPSYGSKAYYFEAPGSGSGRARLLLDIDENDTSELLNLVWISQTDTVTTYFTQPFDGASISLEAKSLGSIPSSSVYRYETPHI